MYAYDVCSNVTCSVVYRKQYRSCLECPVCNTKRHDAEGNALRRMYYMPIAGWIKSLCKQEDIWRWVTELS